jgi:RsiW-degrading membrane proteinase PrsW (M82 family)
LGTLSSKKLRHALLLLGLAESPIALQMLRFDRSYLFFVFSLAWAMALYAFLEPPRRAVWLGLAVYILTAVIAVPLLLAWLGPTQEVGADEPAAHQLWTFIFGVGVREELCKAAALLILLIVGRLLRLRFSSREGMLYGAMSGLAFAAAENLEALRRLSHLEEVTQAHGMPANATVAVALSRLALTPLAHACWSATVGYACTVPLRSPRLRLPVVALALLVVVGLHGLYDESAAVGNRLGVGVLLALSFSLTLVLLARPEQGTGEGTHVSGAASGVIA